jgi:hypothetical protein
VLFLSFYGGEDEQNMQIKQIVVGKPAALASELKQLAGFEADLVLAFAAVDYFRMPDFTAQLQSAAPRARLLGCTTAGEISPEGVSDGSCVLSAVRFADTHLIEASTPLANMDDSRAAGRRLGEQLQAADLKAVLVLGPGVQINGSALVEGILEVLGDGVPITGGLGGDGGAFQQTWTLGRDGVASDRVVALGLCGDRVAFAHGSFGGWEPFGPARKITRCVGNVLYELDGEPALDVYKRYLGDHAKDLPASGLLFPFSMLGADHSAVGLIRTILGIDEAAGSLILAGEIFQDGYLKLMHATTDKLVNGAEAAADAAAGMQQQAGDTLAILISCIGRKLVMGARVDEEVEAVGEVLGRNASLCGFYSYGEISPFAPGVSCKLHNQTMTITCIGER